MNRLLMDYEWTKNGLLINYTSEHAAAHGPVVQDVESAVDTANTRYVRLTNKPPAHYISPVHTNHRDNRQPNTAAKP